MSGLITCNPSIADDTEIGGVIIPSANKAAPPIIAGNANHLICILRTNAYKEKIPPSPLLSALSVRIIYFTVVCKVHVQNIHEIPPSTNPASIVCCPMMALITYKGDVPISPKIIPSVTKSPAAVTLLWLICPLAIIFYKSNISLLIIKSKYFLFIQFPFS